MFQMSYFYFLGWLRGSFLFACFSICPLINKNKQPQNLKTIRNLAIFSDVALCISSYNYNYINTNQTPSDDELVRVIHSPPMFVYWYRPIKNIQKTPINSNIFTIFEIGLDQFKNQPNHLRCLNCKGFYMFVYWSIPIYKPIKHLKNQHIFHHFKNWSIPISTVNFLIFADVF